MQSWQSLDQMEEKPRTRTARGKLRAREVRNARREENVSDAEWAADAVRELLQRCLRSLVAQLERDAAALKRWAR